MATQPDKTITAGKRLVVVIVVGLIVGIVTAIAGAASYAPLIAWDVASVIYVAWVLLTVLRFDAKETKMHATRENPGRGISDVLLIVASIASLVGVGFLVFTTGDDSGLTKGFDIALGLVSVIVSWSVIHTTYILTYARIYYGKPEGGINFNQKDRPSYVDFAYLAFTLGMAFQVSDTAIETQAMRVAVLKHALLSYIFGTVIIATTINTLASLSS